MKKHCFVIMGYGRKTDPQSGKTFDLDKTYLNIIKPAVLSTGLECIRGDEIKESGLIDKSMYALLVHSDIVIADITTFNPNAIYAFGVRHASRPHSTIILKEENNTIPFDLSHNKIFHYAHLGDDIGVSEAERCQKELASLINEILKSPQTDSPFFQYIQTVEPYKLPEEEYISAIKELSEKEDKIFALVEHAKAEMKNSNFSKAAELWKKANKKVDNEPFFIQQWALATYKSKKPTERTALLDAIGIIDNLEIEGKKPNDPETLGITGAIYKRLWLLDNDVEYLNRAIDYYGKGFKINSDYYTGENYALCLDFRAEVEKDNDERIYYKIEAQKTRKAILTILDDLLSEDDYENRHDIKWIYASYSNCSLALNDLNSHETFEERFYSENPDKWEAETYEDSKNHIKNIT